VEFSDKDPWQRKNILFGYIEEEAMQLSGETKIDDLLNEYPFLVEAMIEYQPKFAMLKNPVMRKTIGSVATLRQAASIGGIPLDSLINRIAQEISKRTGQRVDAPESADTGPIRLQDADARHEVLKDIIRDLHAGQDIATLKQRFAELIKDVAPGEIAAMEQRLIAEGMPETEVKRLCDVHVQVFQDALQQQDTCINVQPGHPVHTFLRENRHLGKLLQDVELVLARIGTPPDDTMFRFTQYELAGLIEDIGAVNLHYLRKENQLFPLLEAHGITAPPKVMWAVHDDIRTLLKETSSFVVGGNAAETVSKAAELVKALRDMIYKEEKILIPMALAQLSESDWIRVRTGEEEIGYAWEQPEAEWPVEASASEVRGAGTSALQLDTGALSPEQVNLMLKALPVDVSFVDENDEVRYYSATNHRIFPRSPAVIGRKVQNCHPQKSMHMVQRILDEFRASNKDEAEFWIEMGGKFIHIRYFAMRDGSGVYRGCLEVSQDVTGIRSLKGQKRLLDWD